ncbi:MAG: discoidin domain-containing protein, partial [Solirubrobacterales bacterium]|nr:discoidin domain-containing protein [Solirubrobacterales bacterium]
TNDQANDAGFSRLDDGSLGSFWKSNPYLDSRFTHETNALHPQWVLIDLGSSRPVDGIRIAWGAPYATRFQVQQYLGSGDPTQAPVPAGWTDFPTGRFAGRGGSPTLRLAPAPIRVRYLRVLMSASSHTGPGHSRDIRDRLGYAIRELYAGRLDSRGVLHDMIVHTPSQAQTTIYVSSTDPWHRMIDRDPGYEQPSFQTVLRSGLTRRLPLLVPVPVLYGTPENAVAELRYLQALRVPLRGVELGEEPDGQLAAPEDYGALYVQFARAIHRAFPRLPLGGPGYQTSLPDWVYWPNANGDVSWTRRFVEYLRAHGAMKLLSFFSFEWYPFDNTCLPPGSQLATMSQQLTSVLNLQYAEGIPRRLPVYVTEYGYSAFAGQDEVDFPGALLDADTVGTLLNLGASGAYLYGYEPASLMVESEPCSTWGNLTMIQSNDQHRALHRVSTFWETQMITHDWAQQGVGVHVLYRAGVEGGGGEGQLVHAYAVRRPDGRLALLVLNLSPRQPFEASVSLQGSRDSAAPGRLAEWQFSSTDYHWRDRGPLGLPQPDRPPVQHQVGRGEPIRLPPFSITVLRTSAPLARSG